MCQYEMTYYHTYEYNRTNFTCYTHLQCNRGPFPTCLDWSKICDGQVDCLDDKFDEEYCWQLEINECNDNEYRCTNGQCIPQSFFRDDSNIFDCLDGSDEILMNIEQNYKCNRDIPSFKYEEKICQFIELSPIIIEEQNVTDEKECEQWSYINIYTRCDGLWNCPHGEDEIGCNLSSTLNYSLDHHKCVSLYTNELIWLPIKQANDGKIDCLGATDEPTLCQEKYHTIFYDNFYCIDSSYHPCIYFQFLCNDFATCDHEDDERFCMSKTVEDQTKNMIKPIFSSSFDRETSHQYELRCHRGFDLRVWLNNEKNLTTNTCFCPPSFYGNMCQYQNERMSLTIKFRALSDSWSTLFAIIISLIDDSEERLIHSYEQFIYLSIRDFDIPQVNDNIQSCSRSQCIHGKCVKYSNNQQNTSFCQCNRGWSGRYCTIQYTCICSSDSICIDILAYT
ncbi:unnamed protein product [Rotaria sp. Silwood1]|nr:unnamed protein product [Rotaria sp. Silwood1]